MFFGFFLLINSSPWLTFYRHIVAVKATIDMQSPHAKLLCLNISNEVEISSFWSWQKIYKVTGEITSVTPRRMIKIACDLTSVKCTKDARSWLQKFALPATKLRKSVIALSAGCCNSLLLLLLFVFSVLQISCAVTKPKLGLSLGTKVKICCTTVSRWRSSGVGRYWSGRLDIDVFWLFSFN